MDMVKLDSSLSPMIHVVRPKISDLNILSDLSLMVAKIWAQTSTALGAVDSALGVLRVLDEDRRFSSRTCAERVNDRVIEVKKTAEEIIMNVGKILTMERRAKTGFANDWAVDGESLPAELEDWTADAEWMSTSSDETIIQASPSSPVSGATDNQGEHASEEVRRPITTSMETGTKVWMASSALAQLKVTQDALHDVRKLLETVDIEHLYHARMTARLEEASHHARRIRNAAGDALRARPIIRRVAFEPEERVLLYEAFRRATNFAFAPKLFNRCIDAWTPNTMREKVQKAKLAAMANSNEDIAGGIVKRLATETFWVSFGEYMFDRYDDHKPLTDDERLNLRLLAMGIQSAQDITQDERVLLYQLFSLDTLLIVFARSFQDFDLWLSSLSINNARLVKVLLEHAKCGRVNGDQFVQDASKFVTELNRDIKSFTSDNDGKPVIELNQVEKKLMMRMCEARYPDVNTNAQEDLIKRLVAEASTVIRAAKSGVYAGLFEFLLAQFVTEAGRADGLGSRGMLHLD